MPSLRKKQTEDEYQIFMKYKTKDDPCIFCHPDLLVKEYKHWRIVKNRFPYDAIAQRNDMIAPKRHVANFQDLEGVEKLEYYEILEEVKDNYTYVSLNMPSGRSLPEHYHEHLIKLYD